MKEFLIVYYNSAEAVAAMQTATPEQKMEGMKHWLAWKAQNEAHIVNFGAPVQPGEITQTANEWQDSAKEISGFSIIKGESLDAVKVMLKNHPHLQSGARASISVHPFIPMS